MVAENLLKKSSVYIKKIYEMYERTKNFTGVLSQRNKEMELSVKAFVGLCIWSPLP